MSRSTLSLFVLIGAIVAGSMFAPTAAQAEGRLAAADQEAKYAVGFATNFVRDYGKPFDHWGSIYKSDEYQKLLDEIDAAGTPRTTVTNIYYPTPKGRGNANGRATTTLPSPLPAAAQGDQITMQDVLAGNEAMLEVLSQFGMPGIAGNPFEELNEGFYQSHKGAPIADGTFPLIILVHGLGGPLHSQATTAEYLASQGYIAVVVSMTSDDSMSPVFEDPDNEWAKTATESEIANAYQLMAAQAPVFTGFAKFLFDYDGSLDEIAFGGNEEKKSELKASREGAIRSGRMMGNLFEQRTEDVRQVIFEMKKLNMSELECKVSLVTEKTSKPLCGFFAGHIDVDNIGVAGMSLGSMTSQSALAFLEDVDTAAGAVNGMPRMWEPYGGLPGDPGDGVPAGVQKPYLSYFGSDDFFVHTVFRVIHGTLFEEAGGNPADNYPLAAEQVWPTEENTQPVGLSAYERAGAEKMMITWRDQGHGTSDFASFFPGTEEMGQRVPLSKDAPPERFKVLGWVSEGDNDIYLPRLMKNYFLTHWFDWQLKGDDKARVKLLEHPFENGVKYLREEGVSR